MRSQPPPILTLTQGHTMNVPSDWWSSFFQGVAVDMWLSATTPELSESEVEFLLKVMNLPPGAKILDVPCGGGRHSVPLAKRGYAVTGIDFSSEFLKAAQTLDTDSKVEWVQGDMRTLSWADTFDAAFSLGNSFPYFDDAGNLAFLEGVCRALKSGGKFVIATGAVAESLLPNYQERRWYELGDILFAVKNEYDCERGQLNTAYTFVRNGQVETRYGFQRVYSCSELIRMCKTVGFTDIQMFGGIASEPYKLGSHWLCLVGTKAG